MSCLGCYEKIPLSRGLNNKHLVFYSLEAEKFKIKVQAESVSSEASPCFADGFLHSVSSHGKRSETSGFLLFL